MRARIAILLKAHDCARDLGVDCWDLAVEIDSLRAAGLSTTDLRWLAGKGYVEHAAEIESPRKGKRSFQKSGRFQFTATTCMVLTAAGVEMALGSHSDVSSGPQAPKKVTRSSVDKPLSRRIPRWDRDCRELWLGNRLVKRFKQPAPSQETILDAFEEESWPTHIDDPLPPQPEKVPERHLNETINNLNRRQKYQLVRFEGDGTGRGVRWILASKATEKRQKRNGKATAKQL